MINAEFAENTDNDIGNELSIFGVVPLNSVENEKLDLMQEQRFLRQNYLSEHIENQNIACVAIILMYHAW